MEQIINKLIDSFDFSYMLAVNILTYVIIKIVDQCNGDKPVPVWLKRIIAVVCGIIVAISIVPIQGYNSTLVYSFIASLISWDIIFKPIIKKLKGADYKK